MDYFNDQSTAIIIAAIGGLLFYLFNELEDACKLNLFSSQHSWLNSSDSWRNKYAKPLRPYRQKWYNFGTKPDFAEAFPYSSTVLVFLTDGEHFFQFMKFRVIEVTILLLCGWFLALAWMAGSTLMKVIKEVFFKKFD